MYRIHYIFQLTDGTCIMRFATIQCPIEISQTLYNKIMEGIEDQSQYFKSTHIQKDTKLDLKALFDSKSFKYLQKRLPIIDDKIDVEKQFASAFVQVNDGYIFRTDASGDGEAKGNKGPCITANPDFKLQSKHQGGYYYKTETKEITLDSYYDKIADYKNNIKELEAKKEKIENIIANNGKRSKVIYNEVKKDYDILIDQSNLPKGNISANDEEENIIELIASSKKELEDYKTAFETNKIKHDTVGGVPILISEDDMNTIENSSEISEFEYRSYKPIEFEISYIKSIWVADKYKISDEILKKDDVK